MNNYSLDWDAPHYWIYMSGNGTGTVALFVPSTVFPVLEQVPDQIMKLLNILLALRSRSPFSTGNNPNRLESHRKLEQIAYYQCWRCLALAYGRIWSFDIFVNAKKTSSWKISCLLWGILQPINLTLNCLSIPSDGARIWIWSPWSKRIHANII